MLSRNRGTTRRTVRRAAAVSATVLAVTTAASFAALTAQAQGTGATAHPVAPAWHIVKQVHNGPLGGFTAVVAVGKNGGWAFNGGTVPTAWHRSGSTWTQVKFPAQANQAVVAAGATSASNVWAFTADGAQSQALKWNGRSWTVERSFSREIGGGVVISPSDVWVFGEPFYPSSGLGAWHYNGRTWSYVASGYGLEGGSALSAHDIWAVDGADVAHWNGTTWSRTSVAQLLPAKQELNHPSLTGIFAMSKDSVYAIANGNLQDEGGPIDLLHWNGRQWSKVAQGQYGFGVQPFQAVSSDGHGGLWIPMPGALSGRSYLLHYSAGHLTQVALPVSGSRISLLSVALIPGTDEVLAGGDTHAANSDTSVVATILQYGI
jgi:hypothetical protein